MNNKTIIIKNWCCQTPVAHACNPSYLAGRDRMIMVQSQPGKIVYDTLSRKKTLHKKGWQNGSR
jgi:hypothetical protein